MKQKLKYENVYTDSENDDDDDVKNTNSKKLLISGIGLGWYMMTLGIQVSILFPILQPN